MRISEIIFGKGSKAGICTPFLGLHGTPFEGALDDFRIYNRALEAKEIQAAASRESAGK